MQQTQQFTPSIQVQKCQIHHSRIPQRRAILRMPNIQIIQNQIPQNVINQVPKVQIQSFQIPQQQHKPHPKSKFTPEEDNLLKQLVSKFGENDWNRVSELMPHRNVRQCKERWTNYLSPKVCNDPWTEEDDALLLQKYNEYGAKWVRIALCFPNRTDSNVKNRYLVLSRRSKKNDNIRYLKSSDTALPAPILNTAKIKNTEV